MTTCRVSQFRFCFYRKPVECDFSGGQITGDAGLLPLRAFDEHHHLTHDWAGWLDDPRSQDRVQHDALALLRQRVYQIVAGYEDANDADRLRHDPALQIIADQKLGEPLGSQPTLSRRLMRSSVLRKPQIPPLLRHPNVGSSRSGRLRAATVKSHTVRNAVEISDPA